MWTCQPGPNFSMKAVGVLTPGIKERGLVGDASYFCVGIPIHSNSIELTSYVNIVVTLRGREQFDSRYLLLDFLWSILTRYPMAGIYYVEKCIEKFDRIYTEALPLSEL